MFCLYVIQSHRGNEGFMTFLQSCNRVKRLLNYFGWISSSRYLFGPQIHIRDFLDTMFRVTLIWNCMNWNWASSIAYDLLWFLQCGNINLVNCDWGRLSIKHLFLFMFTFVVLFRFMISLQFLCSTF